MAAPLRRRPAGHRQPQPGQGRGDRGIAGAVRDRRRLGRRAGPPRTRGNRRQLRRQRGVEGARRGRGQRPAGARRRFRASWCRRWAARPGSIRRAGPARTRISAARWRASSANSATATAARHFVAVLALAWPDGGMALFRGEVAGHLVLPPRGERGFGYDPIFVPEGGSLTFGEMDPAGKAPDQPPRPRLRQAGRGVLRLSR